MRIGRKLAWFAAETGRGLSPPLYKFLRDMLAGMVAKKSILLSDVGRALNEDTGRSFFKAIADRLAAPLTRRKPKIHVHPNCGERGLVYRPAEARPNLCKS